MVNITPFIVSIFLGLAVAVPQQAASGTGSLPTGTGLPFPSGTGGPGHHGGHGGHGGHHSGTGAFGPAPTGGKSYLLHTSLQVSLLTANSFRWQGQLRWS